MIRSIESQHIADMAIEALDHPAGLGVPRTDEPVFDMMLCTGLVEEVASCRLPFTARRETIGEALSIVCQRLLNLERRLVDNAMEERLCVLR